jgi:hypothetical protein
LSEAEIETILGDDPDLSTFPEAERVLFGAGVELLAKATLAESTVSSLGKFYSHQEIVEVFFVVGHFRTLAGMLNGLRVDVDPQGEDLALVTSTPAYPQSAR